MDRTEIRISQEKAAIGPSDKARLPRLMLIHETNPQKYYPALYDLAAQGKIIITGSYRNSVFKEWLRSAIKDKSPFWRRTRNSVADLGLRLKLPWISGQTILIAFAPWDYRLLIYRSLLKRNKVIYHTSWPDWRTRKTPRQAGPLNGIFRRFWVGFLSDPKVHAVAVLDGVARSLQLETGTRATVIPHAVPKVFFDAGRSRTSRDQGPLRLMFVGEISAKKGIALLLDIISALPVSDVVLTIVGSGPLEGLIAPGKVPANVQFLGTITDRAALAAIMADHDLLILLSQRTKKWEELFGIVITEALAAGMGVIASNHIGPRSILGASSPGLFEENDVKGVVRLLEGFISNRALLQFFVKEQGGRSDMYAMERVQAKWLEVLS